MPVFGRSLRFLHKYERGRLLWHRDRTKGFSTITLNDDLKDILEALYRFAINKHKMNTVCWVGLKA